MAVLQRRDPAQAADRLKRAIGGDAEVRVVNRQICIILTPLAADRVAGQLTAPTVAAPAARTEGIRVAMPATAPQAGADPRDYFSPLGLDQRPPSRGRTAQMIEDRPPVVIAEVEPVEPAAWPTAAPTFVDHLPPLVLEDFAPVGSPEVSAAEQAEAGQPGDGADRASRAPQWVRRLEGAVRDELDWYRGR